MTKRTTDEWQTLLDGTPPAPWKPYALERHPNSDTYIVGADGRRVAGSDRSDAAVPHGSTDLVTAAPEAVAEVVRLRRALERLREECKFTVDNPGGHDGYTPDEVAHQIEHAHYTAITRILEGHNDE